MNKNIRPINASKKRKSHNIQTNYQIWRDLDSYMAQVEHDYNGLTIESPTNQCFFTWLGKNNFRVVARTLHIKIGKNCYAGGYYYPKATKIVFAYFSDLWQFWDAIDIEARVLSIRFPVNLVAIEN